MLLLGAISLSDTDKLEVLQRLDQFREWNSLDNKRYCLCCSKIITGYEIQVSGGTRGMGPMRIVCPTQGCHSIPMDWSLTKHYQNIVASPPSGRPAQHLFRKTHCHS